MWKKSSAIFEIANKTGNPDLLRLCLDTNVWISAFLTRGGTCEKLVRSPINENLSFIASQPILDEVEVVLSRKFRIPNEVVENRIRYIVRNSLLVTPEEHLVVVKSCEADNRILECAMAGRASYLVTGDRSHLLPL